MQNISLVQFESLLGCVNLRSAFGPRDHAMLRLAAFTGLRVAELVGLNVSDVHHAGQVRSTLFVRPAIAKGGRGRSVPLCQGAQRAAADLVAFLRMRGFSYAPEAPLIVVRQHRRIQIVALVERDLLDAGAIRIHDMKHEAPFAAVLILRRELRLAFIQQDAHELHGLPPSTWISRGAAQ